MTELLDAVDDLTLPRPVKVTTDDGHTWATEDALLVQLEEAVASGLGSASGGSAAPWARNLFDADALYKAGLITSQIGDWCRIVGVKKITRRPIDDLRAWYAAYVSDAGDSLDDFYVRKLREWAEQIRTMLNPPKTLEMTSACPECLEGFWYNEDGDPVPNPITVNYWANGVSVWDGANAKCRSCGHEWRGEWQLRALRHAIDEMDATRDVS